MISKQDILDYINNNYSSVIGNIHIYENEISTDGKRFSFQQLLDFAEKRGNAAIRLCVKL